MLATMAPAKLRLKMAPRRRGLGCLLGCAPRRRGRDHRGPRRPPGCQHRRFGPGGRRHPGPFRTAFRKLKTIPGVALGVPRSSGRREAAIVPLPEPGPLAPGPANKRGGERPPPRRGPARGPEALDAPGRVASGLQAWPPAHNYRPPRAAIQPSAPRRLPRSSRRGWLSADPELVAERAISESGLVTSRRRHCSV